MSSNTYLRLLVIGLTIIVITLFVQRQEANTKTVDCVAVWKTQGEAAGEACFIEHPDDTEVTE